MKLVIIKAACIAAILSSPWIASSQHYYVVVGAFAADENASEFRAYVPAEVPDSALIDSDNEKVLRFYVLKTSDKNAAISKTLQLKKEIEAWNTAQQGAVTNTPENKLSGSIPKPAGPVLREEEATKSIEDATAASGGVSGAAANAGKIPAPPVGKYFKFKVESPEGGLVPAQVHHVDFDDGLELAAYDANTFVDLLRPGQTDEPMAVVCGLFGYKEIHKYIDYADPASMDREAFVDEQGVWVIPYKLERVEEGDVSVMYNVSFYKDAVVMRKPSRSDLDELVKMMHSNPYYEITIHAHCNGKKKREIIALGPDRNYFDVAGSVKITGTAKDLTALRAEAIRDYLVENGIDAGRIDIFAWGGSDMLVKADDPHANLNDRIEIEFTRD